VLPSDVMRSDNTPIASLRLVVVVRSASQVREHAGHEPNKASLFEGDVREEFFCLRVYGNELDFEVAGIVLDMD
jgi:hypothetical protein